MMERQEDTHHHNTTNNNSNSRQKLCLLLAVGFLGLLMLFVIFQRPANYSQPYQPYFKQINDWHQSTSSGILTGSKGDGVVFVDLDRIDQNAKRLVAALPAQTHLRLVAKSLPSLDLIDYIANISNTNRIMIFHASLMEAALHRWTNSKDYLLGVPFTVNTFRLLLEKTKAAFASQEQWKAAIQSIKFLVDSKERMIQYSDYIASPEFAGSSVDDLKIKVVLEIDVGLHRGGAKDPAAMLQMLHILQQNPKLEFSGFMGYDGHCQGTPYGSIYGEYEAMNDCVREVIETYNSFIQAGRSEHVTLFSRKDLIFNGGGSTTVALYKNFAHRGLNELCTGSAFLKPGDFDVATLKDFAPAQFIGGTVIKKLESDRNPVPFLPDLVWKLIQAWDPNMAEAFYIEGSSMPTVRPVSPPGLTPNPIFAAGQPSGLNIFPTQHLMQFGASVSDRYEPFDLRLEDIVFFRPMEADAMLGYGHLLALRIGKNVTVWDTFQYGI